MADARIVNIVRQETLDVLSDVRADLALLSTGLLDEEQELANAVKVALMTDALADPSEILPDPDSIDRRGWWGDLDAEVIWNGWPIGCKNWLLTRAKIVGSDAEEGSTLVRAEEYTKMALNALLSQRIASRIDVEAVRVDRFRIDVLITIYRGARTEIELRFQLLWNEIAGVRSS